MRFCVGDITTTCRATTAAAGGEGKYEDISYTSTDTEDTGRSSRHQTREKSSSIPNDENLVGVPEPQKVDRTKEPPFRGMDEAAWTQAPSVEAEDRLEKAGEVELPFCFMTLALNAMPFITHHAPVFE